MVIASKAGYALLLPAFFLGLVSPPRGTSQQATDSGAMTLEQFRSAVERRMIEAAPPAARRDKAPAAKPDLREAEEIFFRLLAAQARHAAAQQSLDRLSGWSKAIQARFEAQNAPELDVQTIRFAEARMAAESDRLGAERRQAVAVANVLLGRSGQEPLTALPGSGAEGAGNGVSGEDLLAQGRELLARMYQSYSFGGTALPALLWQEQQVYQAELSYRAAAAAAASTWPSEGVK